VPYDEKQNDPVLESRAQYELPIADTAKRGTVQYIPYTNMFGDEGYYLGVYLPADYDENRSEPYKVMYLAHGMFGDETDWMVPGNTPNILDNMIAKGEIEPTVFVTMGNHFTPGAPGRLPSYNTQNAADNLVQSILPFIEANFNVSDQPQGRGVGGFSAGGMTTNNVIKTYPNVFGYYGFFSGNGSYTAADYDRIANSAGDNIPFVFLGNGVFEGSLNASNNIRDNFRSRGIPSETAQVRGAHDMMTAGQLFTIFAREYLWKPQLKVTTNANLVQKGDYFDISASFTQKTSTNAVSLILNYDQDKFEYAGNIGGDPSHDSYIDGVTYLTSDVGEGSIRLTMMIPDYNAKDLVNLRFRAKENAELQNTDCTITAIADYVYKTSAGEKLVKQVTGSTNFTTSGLPGDTDNDGKITLIDLSNIIDMFGVKSGEALWAEARFFDFNKNNEIDIADIVAIAKKNLLMIA
jgi:enterochelin esterase-like enzyme